MRNRITSLLAVALVCTPILGAAKACDAPAAPVLTETANEDNGDHTIRENFGGIWEFGKTVGPASQKWQACTWKLERKFPGGKWVTVGRGNERNKVTLTKPAKATTQVRLHSSSCGPWEEK